MNSSDHPRHAIEICIEAADWDQNGASPQFALAHALERTTHSAWRVVCPTLFVECIEPYRTLVIQNETLEELQSKQRCTPPKSSKKKSISQGIADSKPVVLLAKAEIHAPLISSSFASNPLNDSLLNGNLQSLDKAL